jgi:TPR repeat protein
MSKMLQKTVGSWVWGALLATACLAGTAAAQEPATASSSGQVPSDKDLAAANCVIGEERFLPGDYYYCLGGMTYGQHNYGQSVRFFTTAASWASKPAQYVLGVMALNGDHQPKNRALALAWFALASERPDSRFKAAYEEVYKASTSTEHSAADALLDKMRPIYGDATAAVRAERRYADGMAVLNRLNNGGNMYCIEGMSAMANSSADPSRCQPIQQVVKIVDRAAVNVFEGWAGHVTVGDLQQVPPATKASNGAN